MRKRAQLKNKQISEEPKHITMQMRPKIEAKPYLFKKNWWIAVSIIGLFLILLFFNTYY